MSFFPHSKWLFIKDIFTLIFLKDKKRSIYRIQHISGNFEFMFSRRTEYILTLH